MIKMIKDEKECPYKKRCRYSHCPKDFQTCFEFLRHRANDRKKFLETGKLSSCVNKKVMGFWEKSAEKDIKPIKWKPRKIE